MKKVITLRVADATDIRHYDKPKELEQYKMLFSIRHTYITVEDISSYQLKWKVETRNTF